MNVRAFGHGKVILLGEHGVVYGRPALAVALDRGVLARCEEASADVLAIEPWSIEVRPADDLPLARAFAALLAQYDAPLRVRVSLDIGLPAGSGLGCSAAMGVAITRALDATFGIIRDSQAVAEASMAWERVFHGTPSGIDSAISALGGAIAFRRGEPPEPIALTRSITLVVGDSGEPSSTKEMVELVAKQRARTEERVEKVFDGIAALVQSARIAIASHDLTHLGSLMSLNHALLSSLMLSTPRIEELVDAAKRAGAAGAKVTGSGGGGCMIALATSETAGEAIRTALTQAGAAAFVARVEAR